MLDVRYYAVITELDDAVVVNLWCGECHEHQLRGGLVGVKAVVLCHFHAFAVAGLYGAPPVVYLGLLGVCLADVECQLTGFVADDLRGILLAVMLADAVDAWQVMVVALHGPYLIALLRECL